MTYANTERSVDAGEPFEVYEFTGTSGVYRYTSSSKFETVDGEEYEPIQIDRTSIEIGSVIDSPMTVDIHVPLSSDLARAYGFANTPDDLSVKIMRAHRGQPGFSVEWMADALLYNIEDNSLVIKTGSKLQSAIGGPASTIYVQYNCNNTLYDARCKVDPNAHKATTVATYIDGRIISVVNMTYGDGELVNGIARNVRTNERRGIAANSDNKLTLAFSFNDIVVGDEIEMLQGCDNRMSTCAARFNNIVNYTGFRYVPLNNPFGEE